MVGSWFSVRPLKPVARLSTTIAVTVLALGLLTPNLSSAASSVNEWSHPVSIGSTTTSASQVGYSVSCASASFCVAVNGNGQVSYRDSGNWTAPASLSVGGSIDAVSCSSSTFCVALAGRNATVYNGHRWSKARKISPAGYTFKISCPTSTFCAAVGASGIPGMKSAIVTFNGHSWTSYRTSTTGATNDRLLGVSCSSSRFCVATNFDGQILTFDGTQWSANRTTGPTGLISVSCTAARFCMAVSISGGSMTSHSGTWTAAKPITAFNKAAAYSVSCATATNCSVVGLSGVATTWTSGRWSTPSIVFPGGYVAGVSTSCFAKGHCVAVNDKGMSASQ